MIPEIGQCYTDHTDESKWKCVDVFKQNGFTYATWEKVGGNNQDKIEEKYDKFGKLVEEEEKQEKG